MAAGDGFVSADSFETTSTPFPLVSCRIWATRSVLEDRTAVAPSSVAILRRESSISAIKTREQPAARRACRMRRPIVPAPMTSAVLSTGVWVTATAWSATATASSMAASAKES